ncbi:hypothetical protein Tco_0352746 [Tanacetum coccineum]
MSGSEPDEMTPESLKVVVFPKFDMHIYTSELTSSELGKAIEEYDIPLDLYPRLPPSGITMNKLPSRYIGLYIEQLEQGGLRVPFSSFFLAVIKHFGVHVSQLVPMGVNRVILFEIHRMSLNINLTVPLFWLFYKLCKQGHWYGYSSVAEGDLRKFSDIGAWYSTTPNPKSFEEYTPPVTYPEDVEKTLGNPIEGLESKEVSPLEEELSLFNRPNEVERGRILEAHHLEPILQQQISQRMDPSHHNGMYRYYHPHLNSSVGEPSPLSVK